MRIQKNTTLFLNQWLLTLTDNNYQNKSSKNIVFKVIYNCRCNDNSTSTLYLKYFIFTAKDPFRNSSKAFNFRTKHLTSRLNWSTLKNNILQPSKATHVIHNISLSTFIVQFVDQHDLLNHRQQNRQISHRTDIHFCFDCHATKNLLVNKCLWL